MMDPATIPLARRLALWGRLVKFSHSIFALPFALSMFLVGMRRADDAGGWSLLWIVVALVAARTAAMAFNRLVDLRYDAVNPRTVNRELPQELLSQSSVVFLLAGSVAIFHFAAALLGTHCLVLAPVVVLFLFAYSYTKRFSRYSHFVLGFCLAMAPGGVWYALVGTVESLPIVLMSGVLLWVAGFDILYSCQDAEFDRALGLFSVPASVGVRSALHLALLLHVLSIPLFASFGILAGLKWPFFTGLALFAVLLLSQHRLVSANDLSRIDAAFFTRNGLASVLFFFAVLLGL